MHRWTERQEQIATVAYALRQLRSLLRRIAVETHPDPYSILDTGTAAAERIIHLDTSVGSNMPSGMSRGTLGRGE